MYLTARFTCAHNCASFILIGVGSVTVFTKCRKQNANAQEELKRRIGKASSSPDNCYFYLDNLPERKLKSMSKEHRDTLLEVILAALKQAEKYFDLLQERRQLEPSPILPQSGPSMTTLVRNPSQVASAQSVPSESAAPALFPAQRGNSGLVIGRTGDASMVPQQQPLEYSVPPYVPGPGI